MIAQFDTRMIRELRGAPITVLVAIIALERTGCRPVTAAQLQTTTGYSANTITTALRALEDPTRSAIHRVTGGWITAEAYQLPLAYQTDENPDIENRKICESDSTTTTTRYEEHKKRIAVAVINPDENRKIYDSLTPDQELVRTILTNDGTLGEPTCTDLATKEWIDPEYAMAHVIRWAYENQETGLLVHRLRNQDQIGAMYRRKAAERIASKYGGV